jgi:indole-3-glycerol phosphate synthase
MVGNGKGYLAELVYAAKRAVDSHAYDINFHLHYKRSSLKEAIASCKGKGINAIIAEVKFASPSMGKIMDSSQYNLHYIVKEMVDGGAVALSILTQPNYFHGSLDNLLNARIISNIPLLMKDIIVSEKQIDAAYHAGADAILLIYSVFSKGLIDYTLDYMIDKAHSYGLEVILEVHDEHELDDALNSNADIIGINNRDLNTMQIDLNTTVRLLSRLDGKKGNKYIISESGITSKEHILYLKRFNIDAFLVGTAIMSSDNIKSKVKELVMA